MAKKIESRTKTRTKHTAPRPKKTAKPATKEIDLDDPEVQRKLGALAVRRAREAAEANARAELKSPALAAHDVEASLASIRDAVLDIAVRVERLDMGARADAVARSVCDALGTVEIASLALVEHTAVGLRRVQS